MLFPEVGRRSLATAARLLILIGFLVLVLSVVTLAQDETDQERYDINRRGLDQLDRINEALHHYGRIFLKVGVVLAGLVLLKLFSPFRIYYDANERLLKRAMRGVDELVKRIEKEAEEVRGAEPPEEQGDGGILAGMAEMAEFAEAEEVPSYVTTVNDRMLDNIRATLKRLRRFREGHADRYRNYMFSVLKGIKTITEECARTGAPSSLAVDVEEYFQDEHRYKAWTKLLSRVRVGGDNQDVADTFLVFVRNIKLGRPLVQQTSNNNMLADTALAMNVQAPAIPGGLDEDTLPVIQQAAVKEAENLVTLIQTGKSSDEALAWQFEFVRRQRQLHQRDEAQRMLVVFLSSECNAWPKITRSRMLPCRTWPHVLYLLGIETTGDLQRRIDNRLLTVQEIVVLEKAFLQTFAKRRSLEYVYGTGEEADLMIDMHVPQIRRESLSLLRRSHETQPDRFDRATQALNEAETPQRGEARRLIEHYVNQRHDRRDAR